MKKRLSPKIIGAIVFIIFLLSVIYIISQMYLAPSGPIETNIDLKARGDYLLMLLQCLLGMVLVALPGIFERKAKIELPSGMINAFSIFLLCAIYLGKVQNFYFLFPHWDTLLHTFSGAALAVVGLSIARSCSKNVLLSPAFYALFAFCFAVAAGTLWEIYEFSADALLGVNMQKYAAETGEALIGQAALSDTMKDIIADTSGALAMSAFAFFSLSVKGEWLQNFKYPNKTPMPVPAMAASLEGGAAAQILDECDTQHDITRTFPEAGKAPSAHRRSNSLHSQNSLSGNTGRAF